MRRFRLALVVAGFSGWPWLLRASLFGLGCCLWYDPGVVACTLKGAAARGYRRQGARTGARVVAFGTGRLDTSLVCCS
jgi:hypothetical protein